MEDRKIKDIGTLKYCRHSYIGKAAIALFGAAYEIDIRFKVYDEGEHGLTENMTMAAGNVLNTLRTDREKVQEAVKAYYDSEVRELAEDGRCDYFVFHDAGQLKQVMEPKELYLVDLERNGSVQAVKAGLFFECNWDDEGFGIRFDGEGAILRMGSGAIIY